MGTARARRAVDGDVGTGNAPAARPRPSRRWHLQCAHRHRIRQPCRPGRAQRGAERTAGPARGAPDIFPGCVFRAPAPSRRSADLRRGRLDRRGRWRCGFGVTRRNRTAVRSRARALVAVWVLPSRGAHGAALRVPSPHLRRPVARRVPGRSGGALWRDRHWKRGARGPALPGRRLRRLGATKGGSGPCRGGASLVARAVRDAMALDRAPKRGGGRPARFPAHRGGCSVDRRVAQPRKRGAIARSGGRDDGGGARPPSNHRAVADSRDDPVSQP